MAAEGIGSLPINTLLSTKSHLLVLVVVELPET
jgi:hypothetical protein